MKKPWTEKSDLTPARVTTTSYAYDRANNRTQKHVLKTQQGATISDLSFNAVLGNASNGANSNQLVSYGATGQLTTFTYDENGNLKTRAKPGQGTETLHWDRGQSGTAFCRRHGLKYPTFATWVQRRRGGRPTRELATVDNRHPAFVEVVSTAQARTSAALSITLADGTRIDITYRDQLPWVAELLRHLSSSRPC